MSKKSRPFPYSKSLYENGQDFFDIHYVLLCIQLTELKPVANLVRCSFVLVFIMFISIHVYMYTHIFNTFKIKMMKRKIIYLYFF